MKISAENENTLSIIEAKMKATSESIRKVMAAASSIIYQRNGVSNKCAINDGI